MNKCRELFLYKESLANTGFTLLELLVVLLIIGISVTFITLTIDTRSGDVEIEAKRLAALLNLAQEEAILNGREYALQFDAKGYSFLELAGSKWKEIEEDDVLRKRNLPEGIDIELVLEGEEVDMISAENTFDEGVAPPRIYLLSSGEFTPYEIVLRDAYSKTRLRIMPGENGKAKAESLTANAS